MLTSILNAYLIVKNNLKLITIVALILTFLYFAVGFYVVRSQRDNLQGELENSKKKITQLEKDIKDITKAHVDLSKHSEELKKKKEDLVERLERPGKKSITELARAKPNLVEKAINAGTAKILKCVEIVTSGGDC
jgi:predicted nuclease with TOPRIM domain